MSVPVNAADANSTPPPTVSREDRTKYLQLKKIAPSVRMPEQSAELQRIKEALEAEKAYKKSQGQEDDSVATIIVQEAAGTALLVFPSLLMVTMANLKMSVAGTPIGLTHIVIAFILSLIAAALLFPGRSFNPAGSIVDLITKKTGPVQAAGAIIGQHIGALIGCMGIWFILGDRAFEGDMGAARIAAGIGFWQALLIETLLVTILWLVISTVGGKSYAPFAAGLTLGLCVMIGAGFTGGAINWARNFGPMLLTGNFSGAPVFILATILGGVIVGFIKKSQN